MADICPKADSPAGKQGVRAFIDRVGEGGYMQKQHSHLCHLQMIISDLTSIILVPEWFILPALGPSMSLGTRPPFYLYICLVVHTGGKLIRYHEQAERYMNREMLYRPYILSFIPSCPANIVHML